MSDISRLQSQNSELIMCLEHEKRRVQELTAIYRQLDSAKNDIAERFLKMERELLAEKEKLRDCQARREDAESVVVDDDKIIRHLKKQIKEARTVIAENKKLKKVNKELLKEIKKLEDDKERAAEILIGTFDRC
jgi:chromosome segregation ATPase